MPSRDINPLREVVIGAVAGVGAAFLMNQFQALWAKAGLPGAEGGSDESGGAPAKAATLLNYAGVRADYIQYTVDRNPHKQNHFLPGTQIPIYDPERISQTRPDYLVILAWNLTDEVMRQMSHIREWGGKFVVLIPEVKIYD